MPDFKLFPIKFTVKFTFPFAFIGNWFPLGKEKFSEFGPIIETLYNIFFADGFEIFIFKILNFLFLSQPKLNSNYLIVTCFDTDWCKGLLNSIVALGI